MFSTSRLIAGLFLLAVVWIIIGLQRLISWLLG